jgi:hypothetical protein
LARNQDSVARAAVHDAEEGVEVACVHWAERTEVVQPAGAALHLVEVRVRQAVFLGKRPSSCSIR